MITLKDVGNPAVPKQESKLEKELNAAKLEEVGFVKSYTYTQEKENGKIYKRKYLKYSKKILCKNEQEERKEMERRLPEHLISKKLNEDLDKEVEKNKPVANPKQKFCNLGIEIELRPNGRKRFFFFALAVVFFW